MPLNYPWSPRANQVDPDIFLQLDPRKMPKTPDFGISEEQPGSDDDPQKRQTPQPQGQPTGAGGGGGVSPPPDSPMPDAIPAQGPGMHSHIGYMPPSRFSPGQEHGSSYPTPPPSITAPTMNSSFGGGGGGDAGGPVGGSGGDNGGSYLPYFPGLGGYDPGGGGGGSSRTKDYATSAGIQYSGGGGDEVGEGDWDDEEEEEEMARGGMVASPRIVRLGERGPEAVMKLGVGERPMRYLRRLS